MRASLSSMTTLRLGGPPKRLAVARSEKEIVDAVREADEKSERLFVLGGGSNVVVGDAGFDGTVLRIASRGVDRSGDEFTIEAGEPWDELVRTIDAAGIECLAGIPGLTGATPMQNVGAYGQEVESTIVRVRAYDRQQKKIVELARNECGFAYRSSIFRGSDRWIITRVIFRWASSVESMSMPIRYAELAKALGIGEGERAPIKKVRDTVVALRRTKGMVLDADDPESTSAGSFFTNPIVDPEIAERLGAPKFPGPEGKVKIPAAWLIERAGFSRGFAIGRVHVSKKHALALVTEPGATTAELLELARTIRDGVEQKMNVRLEPEPIFVGCAL